MKWTPCHLADVPASGGLYAVYLDGRLAYIGLAVDLKKRAGGHSFRCALDAGKFKGRPFRVLMVKLRFEACNLKRRRLESALIQRLRPVLNHKGNPGRDKRPATRMRAGRINLMGYLMSHNPLFRKFVDEIGTQADVAKLLALSPGHVSLLYSGKRKVTPDLAERIDIATQGRYRKEALVFPQTLRKRHTRATDQDAAQP